MNRLGPNSAPEVSSTVQHPTLSYTLWQSAQAVSASIDSAPLCNSLWDFKVKSREYKLCSSTKVDELSNQYDWLYSQLKFLEIMDVMTNMDIKEPFQEYENRLLEVVDEYTSLSERSATIAEKSWCSLWCF